MIWLTAIMVALLVYQMPAVDNAKYTFTSHNDTLIRMNTRTGIIEKCDDNLKCSETESNEKL